MNVTQFIPGGNVPAAGGLLFCYQAGTSTKQNMFTDNTGVPTWTNPLVLDSGGNQGGEVWIPAGLPAKFVLAPSNDTDPPASPYWSRDNISGINDPSSFQTEWVPSGLSATFVNGSTFTFSGADQTGVFTTGRRLKTVNTAGTLYSTITSSAFSTSTTTIGIASDTTGIDSGLSATNYGIINPVNDSLPNFVSVRRFGAKGDGVTDDTAAIQAAHDNCPSGSDLLFPAAPLGYLISSTITHSRNVRFVFQGKRAVTATDLPGSYLLKKSTMTTAAANITINGATWSGGGVLGQAGNTGNGIVVLANNVILDQVMSNLMGNDGIRIGADVDGTNSNIFLLIKPVCSFNGRRGIYVHDAGASIDANAGTIICPFVQSNSEDGLRFESSVENTVIGALCEANGGVGIRFATGSTLNKVYGGDCEANTGQDIQIDSGASFTKLEVDPASAGKITDNGTNTEWVSPKFGSRRRTQRGANVATANNLTLGMDGNNFALTATTQINLINNVGWVDGDIFRIFLEGGAVTVKNNQAASTTFRPILTSTGADYVSGGAGLGVLTLMYDGGANLFRETSRVG
jgi:hypothetical protein